MVFGGNCISKIDGKTVFYEGALPGETVNIEIVNSKKDYDTARVLQVVTPSAHRQKPFCPVYGICGGCNFQYADYELQVQLKKQIVEDLIIRTLGEHARSVPQIQCVSAQPTEYRSRFQFYKGGLKRRNSHNAVTLDDCPCAVPAIRNLLQSKRVQLSTTQRLCVFADERLLADNTRQAGKLVACSTDTNSRCVVQLAGKTLCFDINGFFQSNLPMLEKTLALIGEGLHGKHLLDMYGGTGVLSLFAAERFDKVSIVELSAISSSYAKENYKLNGITAVPEVYMLSGKNWVRSTKAKNACFDALIIDPPRTGIEKEVLEFICAKKPPLIRSLSCDPATHARDAKRLLQAGYIMEKLYMLDFYPQTSHIETLAFFKLKKEN